MGKRTTRQHNAKTQKDKTPQDSSDSTIPKQEKTLSSERRTSKRPRRQNSSVSSFSAAGLKTQNSDEPAPVFSDASRSTHANATGCLDVPVYFQQSALCQLLAGNESPAAMNSGYQMYPILATEQQSQSREATIDVSASASGRPGESTFGVSGGAENRETCSRRLEELNRAFNRLSRLLPVQPAIKKLSKQEILHRAIHHIALLDFLIDSPL